MEGLHAQWAIAIQEYEFTINYCRVHENGNADALSKKVYWDTQLIAATSQIPVLTESLHEQQLTDPVIQALHSAFAQTSSNHTLPQGPKWRQSPLSRYGHNSALLMVSFAVIMHQTQNYLLSSQLQLSLLLRCLHLIK